MGCSKCGETSNDHNCGCESCFDGVMIPVGPQGPVGETGVTGATGPQGPQGEPGQDALIPPLEWIPLTLINDWEATGSITPAYAVRFGLIYLRGIVKNDIYSGLKAVIFNNAPNVTVAIETMAFEVLQAQAVQMRLLSDNNFQYLGSNEESVRLVLDSVPVIRLY